MATKLSRTAKNATVGTTTKNARRAAAIQELSANQIKRSILVPRDAKDDQVLKFSF